MLSFMLNTTSAHLKITGFKNYETIEDIFSSYMVDVAYVVEANEMQILVTGDEHENRSEEYKSWLKSVTQEILKETGQAHLSVEVSMH